jgi:hypothetical protein
MGELKMGMQDIKPENVVSFTYTNKRGETTQRVVFVTSVNNNGDAFHGWDLDKELDRYFLVNSIKGNVKCLKSAVVNNMSLLGHSTRAAVKHDLMSKFNTVKERGEKLIAVEVVKAPPKITLNVSTLSVFSDGNKNSVILQRIFGGEYQVAELNGTKVINSVRFTDDNVGLIAALAKFQSFVEKLNKVN